MASVLVVDDNRATCDMLADVLRDWGHIVRTAYSGSRALTLSAESLPDVIMVEITMPTMDGYEVARRLREALDAPRIVGMSAEPGTEFEEFEYLFDDFCRKPLGGDCISRALGDHAN